MAGRVPLRVHHESTHHPSRFPCPHHLAHYTSSRYTPQSPTFRFAPVVYATAHTHLLSAAVGGEWRSGEAPGGTAEGPVWDHQHAQYGLQGA